MSGGVSPGTGAAERPAAPEGSTLSRAEYERQLHHDYAGTVKRDDRCAVIWREHCPWWDGTYWLMAATTRGVGLGPINVRE